MSLSKGNIHRTRPQKHQNRSAFKNDLHDTSKRTKILKSLQVTGVCLRCKEIIEWKIKYKKYKPLTAPAKCVGCDQKSIKHAYHVLCAKCATEKELCAKCHKPVAIQGLEAEYVNNDNEFEEQLKGLSERKRRTLLRQINKLKSNDHKVSVADVDTLIIGMNNANLELSDAGSDDEDDFQSDND